MHIDVFFMMLSGENSLAPVNTEHEANSSLYIQIQIYAKPLKIGN